MTHSLNHVVNKLTNSANPSDMVVSQLYAKAFDVADHTNDDRYQALQALKPVMVGTSYKGDATEFMGGALQGAYQKLQSMTKRLADSVDFTPFPGEHITAFIERCAQEATRRLLDAQKSNTTSV